jgi:multicomponent Na+:H+ antiporter subunit E
MTAAPAVVAARLAWLALLWIILSGAEFRSPAVAALTVIAATIASVSLWTTRAGSVRWARVPALVLYFARASLVGGIDVARRAFSPTLPLDPGLIRHSTTLGTEDGLVCFVWMVSLMPGTASVGLDGNRLTVHVIDRRMYGEDALRQLERRIAAVFGARAGS